MSKLNKDKLEKLKKLLSVVNDGLTHDEFLRSFKTVIDHTLKTEIKLVEKINKKTEEEKEKLGRLGQEFEQVIRQAKIDSDNTLTGFKRRTLEAINKLFTRNEVNKKLISELNIKLASIKDGDPGKDGEDGIDGIDADPVDTEKITNDILDKLEKNPRNIGIEDVGNLRDELEEIRKIKGKGGGGVSAIGVRQAFKWISHTEEPVGAIDGNNKVYTVDNDIWWIAGFTLNHAQIEELPNFTYAGKTITFATALPAAYNGKDFEIKYIG